ncbi:MAG: menaquinone biosynthetic enzyme MqnA/MqnD family protein [Armatimonadota bacterium]
MKLGCLPYLNVRPLVYYLEHGGLPAGWELVYAPPSQLAQMLVKSEIAAAPVSSYAVLANPQLEICPEICISSDGPVKSVLTMSRVDVHSIRSVAVDTSSLSGVNMLKIILIEGYGVQPVFHPISPEFVLSALDSCDAVLTIGDTAMLYPKEGLTVIDIGEQWKRLTGLPAVFALWAGKNMSSELISVLHRSYAESVQKIDEIARLEAARLELPFDVCYDYLKNTIRYHLGERELRSLEVFREKCLRHGLPHRDVTSRVETCVC